MVEHPGDTRAPASDLVVVVDDEPALLTLVCDVLHQEGYTALCLDHPTLALEIQPETKPSVFLVDLMLPEMTGIELAHQLRQTHFPSTPMIAMSASSPMLTQARAAGVFEQMVRKPFDLLDLLASVKQCTSIPSGPSGRM